MPDDLRIPVTGGCTLHASRWPGDEGRAPFVLVHGLASNLHLWDGVAERLAAAGHPVTAVDQRGHGRSDKPDSGYDLATVSDDLAALIDWLGYDRPVVTGQSWGGNVVVELAVRHPELTRGIVCVDGGWIDLQRSFPDWEACRAALTPPAIAGTPREAVEAMLRRTHPDWPETGIAGALACFAVGDDGTVAPHLALDNHLRILRNLWDERPTGRYPLVRVPVLLVPCDTGAAGWTAGKREAVAAAEAAIPTVRTQWFTADHDVHAQHPDQVADLLLGCVDGGFFA